MEAKVTSTRKLEVYPSKHNKEIETAETIFIEDILKLKNEGDSILLTRQNASGLSCLAYLESRPAETLVMPKIAEVIDGMITDNKKYYDNKEVCWLCYEDDFCYHKYKIEALEELKKKLSNFSA